MSKFWKVIGGVAIALAVVLSVGAFMQTFGKGKVKPSEWFKKQETEQTYATGNNVVLSTDEYCGVELCSYAVPVEEYASYGVSEQSAENVFNLSVTYTPSNATFQETNYTINFSNANSAWASGKNLSEYAELQHTEGSISATLIVKKAFGEKIIVTATSQYDSNLKATFTVDYLKRFTLEETMADGVSADDDFYFTDSPIVWSDGTLTPEYGDGQIKIVYDFGDPDSDADFVYELAANGITMDRYITRTLGTGELEDLDSLDSFYYLVHLACHYNTLSSEKKAKCDKILASWYYSSSRSWVCYYGFLYSRVYNGVTYSGGVSDISEIEWFDLYCTGCRGAFGVYATSMTANTSYIIAA